MLTRGAEPLRIGRQKHPDAFRLGPARHEGGEGVLWQATADDGLSTPIERALKVLPASPDPAEREVQLRALQSLVRLRQSINVPHLVRLHAAFPARPEHEAGTGRSDPRRVLVLELDWVPGADVQRAWAGRPVTAATMPERLRVIREVASVLAALHDPKIMRGNPLVYRDLTPANCMLDPAGGAVLVDPGSIQLPLSTGDGLGRHTSDYCAPEVLVDPWRKQDARSDAWALGLFAGFCLLGAAPSRDPAEFRTEIDSAIREAGAGADLAAHLARLVQTEPGSRPPIGPWLADLIGLLQPTVRRRRRPALVLALVGVLVLAGGGTAVAASSGLLAAPRAATVSTTTVASDPPAAPPPSPTPSAATPSASPSASPTPSPSLVTIESAAPPSTNSIPPSAPSTASSPPPSSAAASPPILASDAACYATAVDGHLPLDALGTADTWKGGGPNSVSSACSFIALKLTYATAPTWARACLDPAEGPSKGRCGDWVKLSYTGVWDRLLDDAPAGSTWTLQLYCTGIDPEDARFRYTV